MAKKTYEELVSRLDEIVNIMYEEDEKITINDSLKLYKEGVDLVIKCNKSLEEYKSKIDKIKTISKEKQMELKTNE